MWLRREVRPWGRGGGHVQLLCVDAESDVSKHEERVGVGERTWPPDRRAPFAPTSVLKPSGNDVIKS